MQMINMQNCKRLYSCMCIYIRLWMHVYLCVDIYMHTNILVSCQKEVFEKISHFFKNQELSKINSMSVKWKQALHFLNINQIVISLNLKKRRHDLKCMKREEKQSVTIFTSYTFCFSLIACDSVWLCLVVVCCLAACLSVSSGCR